ncbi:hypothetical protein O9992_27575 [Vibrio lentus]|nr:hypothetical protein [Vibrio lentus]
MRLTVSAPSQKEWILPRGQLNPQTVDIIHTNQSTDLKVQVPAADFSTQLNETGDQHGSFFSTNTPKLDNPWSFITTCYKILPDSYYFMLHGLFLTIGVMAEKGVTCTNCHDPH